MKQRFTCQLTCRDIMTYKNLSRDLNNMPFDMVYADPPWNEGAVKMFETYLVRDNKNIDKRPENSLEDLYKQFFGLLVDHVTYGMPVMLDCGVRQHKLILQWAKECRWPTPDHISIYSYNKTGTLMSLRWNMDFHLPLDLAGWKAVSYVLQKVKPTTVLDLFSGIGATANCVLKHANFIGSELNPNRVDKALKRLNGYDVFIFD